jgi:large-conductance mechanosensitive channel
MPSIETFLLASSLLSLRQAAEQVRQMLKHARTLVARRQARRDRNRLYWPRKINWARFLRSGGEQDVMVLPENARKEVRTGKDNRESNIKGKDDGNHNDSDSETEGDASPHRRDEEANPPHPRTHAPSPSSHAESKEPKVNSRLRPPRKYSALWLRARCADFIEGVARSEHFAYALKLTIAVMLVSWPAFYGPLNGWYNSMRVVWAPLQLVLVFEVAIGSSLWIFFVRAGGVIFGCVWGYASFEIGRGNLVALVVILVIGIVPSAYVQLGTPYVKAGMISIVSMCIVALCMWFRPLDHKAKLTSAATISGTGPAWGNFVKRLVAFLVGGTVALIVEVVLYPVRARDRLVESLSSSIGHISRMQGLLATGSESPSKVTELRSKRLNARFASANQKAQNSLSAAETFLPFCLSEPRLKGSFRSLEPIYKEIIYVLHQIMDRMDNSISLRQAYGSSVLEDMNPHVYVYRRNVSAAITLTLFAVNEALTTKIPLPQFLPSCRLAQMRLVNRVREVIQTEQSALARGPLPSSTPGSGINTPQRIDSTMIRNATEQKFLSWSAAAAGQMEVIEYLEELVDLTKLLVGVNAFRSGMLERPSYRNYANRLRMMEKRAKSKDEGRKGDAFDGPAEPDEGATVSPVVSAPTVLRPRRTGSSGAFMGLQRSATGTFRKRGVSNLEKGRREREDVEEEEDQQLELPMTLQRMGTRFKQERSLGEVDKSRSD